MAHIGYSWPTFDTLTQEIVRAIGPQRGYFVVFAA